MKVNFSQPMTDMDGQPSYERDAQGNIISGKQWTLERVCRTALLAYEPNLDPAKALQRFDLQMKLKGGGMIDVTLDEITLIKSLVPRTFAPLFYGFVHYAFERAIVGEKMQHAEMAMASATAPQPGNEGTTP